MPVLSKLHSRTILLALACLCSATNARAQSIVKVGIELQINSYTSGRQTRFAVDLNDSGGFVVVYDSYNQDGSTYGIFGRRFNAGGVPQASEFQVNSYTPGSQREPDVALSNDGGFIVVWRGLLADGSFGESIFGRRFDSSGQGQAAEFEVNSYTAGGESHPRVAVDAVGGFVVAWVDYDRDGDQNGIFARRFNAAGVPQNADFQVNSFTAYAQSFPDVAMHGAGDFIIAWQSFDQDLADFGVFGRAFDAAGVPQSTEFQVNAYTGYSQRYPSVAADTTGGFVVAWQSDQYFPSYPDVFARRFSAAGSPAGPEIRANPRKAFKGAANVEASPTVASEPDGDFVVAWNGLGDQDGDGTGVFARRFNAAGTSQTGDIQVNSYTVGFQGVPVVAMDGDGGFVLVWTSSHDGSVTGGFGQRFDTLPVLDVDGNGSVGALTDGLLSLRYEFGFRGTVLVTGVVDLAGCRRCDAPAIEAYLAAQD